MRNRQVYRTGEGGREPDQGASHGGLKRYLMLIVLGWSLSFVSLGADAPQGARVIAHPDVDTAYLTRGFLRSVFTLRVRVWPDGGPVRIFVLDDGDPVHVAFSRDVLGTYPYVLRRTWNRMTFTGIGLIPVRVSTLEEMRQRVMSTPGAIGYVKAKEGDASTRLLHVANRWGVMK